MQPSMSTLAKLAPELFETAQLRYKILHTIDQNAPIGRRILAQRLSLSERRLRTELDFLKQEQYLIVRREGMSLSPEGEALLLEALPLVEQLSGLSQREWQLAQYFHVERVIIVTGDYSKDRHVMDAFGRILLEVLQTLLDEKHNIVTLLGGSTLQEVLSHVPQSSLCCKPCVVSGRGGMGLQSANQANTLSNMLAQRLGGEALALYVPENISWEAYSTLKEEQSVAPVLEKMRQSTCVIHGIGQAGYIADQKQMTASELNELERLGAVAEAFGCFYNAAGEEVWRKSRIGLQREDVLNIPHLIAIAGGSTKAQAIAAYMKQAPYQTCLFCDEGAAEMILKQI